MLDSKITFGAENSLQWRQDMLTPNTVLQHRYQIVRQLGAGGMGAVYLASDMRLGNRMVVVKENRGGDPIQFQMEANILANLSHPNLPHVLDHWNEPGGMQYLAMDYIEGQNLEERVEQAGPLKDDQALTWMRQVFKAVEYLHAHHIIHRDIKPHNIIITQQGKAVLVDFGIAKMMQPGYQTSAGARGIGTPGFAPVEQYSGGTDERSDIYALGATLYYLLTGNILPPAPERAAQTAKMNFTNVTMPIISANILTAIQKAIELAPVNRFQSVQEFEDALTNAKKLPHPKQEKEKTTLEIWLRHLVKRFWGLPNLVKGLVGLTTLGFVFLLMQCASPTRPPTTPAPDSVNKSITAQNAQQLKLLETKTFESILGIGWSPTESETLYILTQKSLLSYQPGRAKNPAMLIETPNLSAMSIEAIYIPAKELSVDLLVELKSDRTCVVRQGNLLGQFFQKYQTLEKIGSYALNPDPNELSIALGDDDGVITVLSVFHDPWRERTPTRNLTAIAFSSDGRIAYSGADNKIRLEKRIEFGRTTPLADAKYPIQSIAFSNQWC